MIKGYNNPQELDAESFLEFSMSLETVKKGFWVGGDVNLPKMDLDTTSPSLYCKHPSFYRQVTETFNDTNLTQMVNLPTKGNNILNLFLTTNPTLENQVNILLGISDHNIVEVKVGTAARIF